MAVAHDVLTRDPTVETLVHRPDDRFVPLRPGDLADALASDEATFGEDARWYRELAVAIADVVDQEAGAFENELCEHYAPFNPDCDTIRIAANGNRRSADQSELLRRIDYLLNKANFERLTDDQIRAAVQVSRKRGLRVRLDPQRVVYVAVWVRGPAATRVARRTWRRPVAGEEALVPLYRRLVVVARLRDDPNVLLKLFKDIPACDMEALLPHAEIEMSWFDRARALGGGAGALGSTATKLLNLITGVVYLTKIVWVILFGALLMAYRGFMGYRRARAARDSQRTRHLYFQNLDNNVGAIHALITMVAQEDVKEALLAYAFCRAGGAAEADDSAARPPKAAALPTPSGQHGCSGPQPCQPAAPGGASPGPSVMADSDASLATRVEAYLRARFGVEVDFDAADALRTLGRLDLWLDRAACRVIPPAEAVDRLRSHWRSHRSRHHHELAIQAPAE